MSEEEKAQAEVEAMLDVEKRQDRARSKVTGEKTKSLSQTSTMSDMHIDSSIIDSVKQDNDKEIAEIENNQKKVVEKKKEVEESSSDEEEEMTEQEKLYGKSESDKKKKHHRHPEE